MALSTAGCETKLQFRGHHTNYAQKPHLAPVHNIAATNFALPTLRQPVEL